MIGIISLSAGVAFGKVMIFTERHWTFSVVQISSAMTADVGEAVSE